MERGVRCSPERCIELLHTTPNETGWQSSPSGSSSKMGLVGRFWMQQAADHSSRLNGLCPHAHRSRISGRTLVLGCTKRLKPGESTVTDITQSGSPESHESLTHKPRSS